MAFHYLGMQVADIFRIVRLDASDEFVTMIMYVLLFAVFAASVFLAASFRYFRIADERDAKRWAERDAKRLAEREADRRDLSNTDVRPPGTPEEV